MEDGRPQSPAAAVAAGIRPAAEGGSLPPGPCVDSSGANESFMDWQELRALPAGLEARLHVSQGWLTLLSRVFKGLQLCPNPVTNAA